MKKRSSSGKMIRIHGSKLRAPSKAHMERLAAAKNDPVDFSDIPELTEEDFRRAVSPSQRFPHVTMNFQLDPVLAKAVKKAGWRKVNRILRERLLPADEIRARKAG